MYKLPLLCLFLLLPTHLLAELPYPDYEETNESIATDVDFLENQIKMLQISNSSMNKQIESLNAEVKSLNDKIEELEYQQNLNATRIKKYSLDVEHKFEELNKKLAKLEEKPNVDEGMHDVFIEDKLEELAQLQPIIPEESQSTAPNNTNPEQQYKVAYNYLQQNQLKSSITEFQLFIAKNPAHTLVSNAYFWLGEAYFQLQDFENSSLQYLNSYQKNPKGQRSADSLLKLGISLKNMGKNSDACTSFAKLGKEFPNASRAIKIQAQEHSSQLNCS